jgi:hypothetical protein
MIGGLLGGFLALAVVTNVRAAWSDRDIAAGQPWRASSSGDECHPDERSCAGTRTRILFHTLDEENPWFEVDLGQSRHFSAVTVDNRSDCCGERAIPLVIEVSDDQTTWREVARNEELFTTWRAQVGAQQARYVRLRVPRKTMLHLEAVHVHR